MLVTLHPRIFPSFLLPALHLLLKTESKKEMLRDAPDPSSLIQTPTLDLRTGLPLSPRKGAQSQMLLLSSVWRKSVVMD